MRVMRVIRVLRRILTDSDIIDLYGLYCEFYKELDRFVKPIQIEVIKSDFETVSFRELR